MFGDRTCPWEGHCSLCCFAGAALAELEGDNQGVWLGHKRPCELVFCALVSPVAAQELGAGSPAKAPAEQ